MSAQFFLTSALQAFMTARAFTSASWQAKEQRNDATGQQRTHAMQQNNAHSITSSARASTDGGIVRPRAFAVLRLTTSSYLVGACTGISAGFSPLRMRST